MDSRSLVIRVSKKDLAESKKQIRNHVCGLLCTGGGLLKIKNQDSLHQDVIILPAEQIFRNILTTSKIVEVFKQLPPDDTGELTLGIPASPRLITLKYNLFLPTDTQVLEIRPVEGRSEVLKILQRRVCETDDHIEPTKFIEGSFIGFNESQTVQFKNLETTQVKKYTFSDRVIRNQFTHYVSAFANHRGGRIYYGVDDNGVITGEEINKREKDRAMLKIKNTIMKMEWCQSYEPKEDVDWKVTFKDVTDNGGAPLIPSKYVMIVYVAPYFGGVFAKKPESYIIDYSGTEPGLVELSFSSWLKYFKMPKLSWAFLPMEFVSARASWSSSNDRKIYLSCTKLFVRYRNSNEIIKIPEGMQSKYKTAVLVMMAEKVAVKYKRRQFDKARKLLTKFELEVKTSTKNRQFHEIKVMYLKSRIERAEGKYEASYETAIDCFKEMQKIPAEFITVWCYMHMCMLANILGIRNNDPAKFVEAHHWLDLASRDAASLDTFPEGFPDLYQKLRIYRAMTLLKCSLIGEVAINGSVKEEDLDAAKKELTKIYRSDMDELMSKYREIQFLFAECGARLRHSQLRQNSLEYVEKARKHVNEAEELAREHNFQDMLGYAKTFKETIEKYINQKELTLN